MFLFDRILFKFYFPFCLSSIKIENNLSFTEMSLKSTKKLMSRKLIKILKL